MRIVFMGTPDFAVSTLDALLSKDEYQVVGVFTQPDKPTGRKQILTPPPVKVRALENNIPVYQPTTLKDGKAFEDIKALNPDVIVVVAYGKFLPTDILNFPKYGCINVHGSLLPQLRGASPIQWSIVSGFDKTGVTTMFMDEGMDTGDMLLKSEVPITEDDDFSTLHDKLATVGADLLLKTLPTLENGTAVRIKQDDALATYAPIIKKEMGMLDFNKNATELRNLIRGFNPWPCAYTFLGGKRLKVLSATVLSDNHNTETGLVFDIKDGLAVTCGEGTTLLLQTVQLEGSKAMPSADMLKGHPLSKGMKIGV